MFFRITGLVFAVCLSQVSRGTVLYFGGDPDLNAPQASQVLVAGPGEGGVGIFDDFQVDSDQWNLTSISGLFLVGTGFSTSFGQFEIRSEVSEGNAGTLIAQTEFLGITTTNTGRVYGNLREVKLTTDVVNVSLLQGTYWLMFRPFGDAFVLPSSGQNAVGSPILNGNTFARSTFFRYNYRSVSSITGYSPYDLSYEIEGTAVPEPATIATLALFGLNLVIWRSRSR